MELNVRDVEAAKRGDRKAYARLVERHQRVVTAITLAITTDVDASEDAAQDAFIQGWRDLGQLESAASFTPWICQIARNRARDLVRKRKPIADVSEAERAADETPGALDALLEAEATELISGALQSLPEESREAMILFYREGQSVAEIAQTTEVSEEVVRKRLSRARERIRGKLETAFGAALIAAVPMGDFTVDVLGRISTPAWFGQGTGTAWRFAVGTAKVGAAAAVIAVAAQTPAVQKIFVPQKIVVATYPAPQIKGTITGAKNVTGTVTFTYANETRTAKIEKGSFHARNLPEGKCRVTFAVDGLPSPEPQDVTLRKGEGLNLEVKVVTVLVKETPAP